MAVAEAPGGVLFDEAQDRRLAEVYAPCLTLILQLRATDAYGDPDVLRRRIADLLDRSERAAMRAGLPSHDIRQAKFAVVAFLDETILLSDWDRRDHWAAKPLQLELYDRYDAGEEFFVKLEELMERPAAHPEVLEVYYLCMTLGFKGRYQLHDQERLRILIEDVFAQLRQIPGMGVGELAPRGLPHDQAAAEMESKVPTWVIAAFALGLVLLAYVGMSLYATSTADRTAQAIDAAARTEVVAP